MTPTAVSEMTEMRIKLISGQKSRLQDTTDRYIATLFCYGCGLGPSQTARSLKTRVDKNQIAWFHHHHVQEQTLEKIITAIINAYQEFELPKHCGSGEHVSADGTKWEVGSKNLLSEYHIRYGGYGGIGYYHVSDTYIALFSRFIPCSVWEAVYILDGLFSNESEIKPKKIHGDTQAQNTSVFGLSYLLGIELMPRIRNWKGLRLYKPTRSLVLQHLDSLFTDDVIDWTLIEEYLPDMLRVVISIQAGRVAPSTILRRLGTRNRKNRLYFAFRELGRVIRTLFLLDFISNTELRSIIQSSTNKSESFNGFAQWLNFGGSGLRYENDRDEQRKLIKYNHLLANLVILHNVQTVTQVINELSDEGTTVDSKTLSLMSPYLTAHINRFGDYRIDPERKPSPFRHNLNVTRKGS
jgi:TnpA family transposase